MARVKPLAEKVGGKSTSPHKKNKLSGGDLLMRSLADEGVDLVFGYPGGAVLHIYDALFRQERVQHILVRHEQAAAHAADGYARATGKPGVVLVTSGPGATNTLTGIATAQMDSAPMVVISGQVALPLIGTDAFQETDMFGACRPLVKHSFMVQDPASIPRIVREAFHIATTGRQGPVVIDIPKNMTDPSVLCAYDRPQEINMRGYQPLTGVDEADCVEAIEILLSARRPVIYAGGGSIVGSGPELLQRLAQLIEAPVTNTLMGLGSYPANDQQFLGMLGMHGFYEANMAMHHSDALLAVGARFDDRITNTPAKFCLEARKIHIDVDPTSINKIISVDVAINAPAEPALKKLIELAEARIGQKDRPRRELADWWQQIEAWRAAHGLWRKRCYGESADQIFPQDVIQALYEETRGEAFVTTDVGQHQMFAAQYYRFDKPRRWITSGGLGTMGFGLPAAMGVQLAFPSATVVCVTGEGSVQMNIQELSTCAQYGLPIKIVNINNQALGMVKQWQDMQYGGRYSHSTYQGSLPDFIELAKSYGHVGIKIEKPEDLRPGLREALQLKDRLVFVDIYVDPSEHVYPMLVAPNGSMRDMWLSKNEHN